MSTLQTRSHATIVASIAAGMQGRLSSFLNFAIGSILRALAESYAGQALWLQFLALQIQMQSRLSTSFGVDADSFVADFPLSGVARLGAQAGTTLCSFGRMTANAGPVYVPVGGQTKTADGTQTFTVTADPTNGAYVASYTPAGSLFATGGYVMPAQVGVVLAPVQAAVPGSLNNVAAGAISLLASAMPGVDTVTNPAAVTNGIDQEVDASLKARFFLAVQGRGGGTPAAIASAVANLRVGMSSDLLEGQDLNGTTDLGMVSVIVDDGSGAISSTLLTAAQAAVNSVRAAGIRTGTYAAVTLPINVVQQITSLPGFVHQNVVAAVTAALGLYIDGLGQGATVGYFALAAVTQGISGVGEVIPLAYTLNGGTTDIVGTPQTTPKAGSLVVS